MPDVACNLRSVRLDPDENTKEPPLAVFEILSRTISRDVPIPLHGLTVVADAIEFPAGNTTVRIPVADLFAGLDE